MAFGNPLKENEHQNDEKDLLSYESNQFLQNLTSFQKNVETHGAPFELASKVTALKEFLNEKEKVVENVKSSLKKFDVAQKKLTSHVTEVEDTLKREKVNAYEDNLAEMMRILKYILVIASNMLTWPSKMFLTK